MAWPTWREATQHALYGPDGFYRRERPGDHFRTSVRASPLFARAVESVARECVVSTVVDLGADDGELLRELHRRAPELELIGVDLASRPDQLPGPIGWTDRLSDGLVDVLVIANEWLDDLPVDVVEIDETGMPCLVHVEPETGAERLGNPPGPDDLSWLARWWPLDEAEPGARAEIGRERDSAWADAVRRVRRGVLVAIDYWHRRGDRPPAGTLAAYRAGRMVPPVPDGSCDITAHVALDSCASAGDEAGATATLLTTQRQALRALGVDASLPPRTLALDDSQAYLAALSQTTQAIELLDPAGLGAFGWLVQTVNRPLPDVLARLDRSTDRGVVRRTR
ncbi:MAG: SAM-dependent methyltransferase [Jiangellaceae bacterium]